MHTLKRTVKPTKPGTAPNGWWWSRRLSGVSLLIGEGQKSFNDDAVGVTLMLVGELSLAGVGKAHPAKAGVKKAPG